VGHPVFDDLQGRSMEPGTFFNNKLLTLNFEFLDCLRLRWHAHISSTENCMCSFMWHRIWGSDSPPSPPQPPYRRPRLEFCMAQCRSAPRSVSWQTATGLWVPPGQSQGKSPGNLAQIQQMGCVAGIPSGETAGSTGRRKKNYNSLPGPRRGGHDIGHGTER
jgi:hypothetical protein